MGAEQIARYKPGENVTVFAKAAILAGRFVAIVAAPTSQGAYQGEHAAENARLPFGVAQRDSAATTYAANSTERLVECVRRGAIARVLTDGEVKAGEEVMVGEAGKAKAWAEKKEAVGRALTTGATGKIIEVDLY